MTTTLRFDWITTCPELDALRDVWTRLDDGSSPGAVFRTWEWQAAWWKTLGRDETRKRQLRVLVGRDVTGVRGILPLYTEEAPVGGLVPRRRVGFLGDDTVGSDYLGLVAPGDQQAELAPLFAGHVASAAELRDADVLDLRDLLDGEIFAGALHGALSGGGFDEVTRVERYVCPYARLDMGLEAYLGSRPQSFGSQAKRRKKELSKKEGFKLTVHEKPDAIVAALDPLFALHKKRWQEEGGSEAFTSPRIESFHRAAGRLLAERGFARLCTLEVGGEPVAAGYGFMRGNSFAYYQAGIEPEWRRKSAGTVVLAELIGRAAAEGAAEFDFLRGNEAYKAIWATDTRHTFAVRARPDTWGARLAAGAERAFSTAKGLADRHLPQVTSRMRRYLKTQEGKAA